MNGAREAMRLYNYNRQCLVALGIDVNDPVLKELKDTKLWCKNVSKARHLGSSKDPDPWYWSIGTQCKSNGDQEKWKLEMHHVKWFQDQAAIDRWTKEKEILEVEYQRVVTAHSKMEDVWAVMGDEYRALSTTMKLTDALTIQHQNILHGFQAYAHKQARVYRRLKADVIEQWGLKVKVKPSRKRKWHVDEDDEDEEEGSHAEEYDGKKEWEDLDDWNHLDEEESDGED
ncbi:hypothetical protein AAF712_010173 [Marasmius tenuissimus]|uniref:Uncharacterized protein n=1 Tax=Marasmius tenuissimus TaxID=585030 RepID=A0ABR2ZRF2_9AGAR